MLAHDERIYLDDRIHSDSAEYRMLSRKKKKLFLSYLRKEIKAQAKQRITAAVCQRYGVKEFKLLSYDKRKKYAVLIVHQSRTVCEAYLRAVTGADRFKSSFKEIVQGVSKIPQIAQGKGRKSHELWRERKTKASVRSLRTGRFTQSENKDSQLAAELIRVGLYKLA